MTTTPPDSPSWYDLVGVPPTASADEIRSAWRAAIADLDPTDRRFATLSRAAEVLLDPDRRAAYDAQLALAEPESAPAPVPEAGEEPLTPLTPRTPVTSLTEPPPVADPAPVAAQRPGGVPAWLLVGLAVAVLVVAGVATWVALTKPSDDAVGSATAAAQSAAERAIVPILSYDAGNLEESRAAAQQYLTGDYRTEYDRLFDGIIEQNAPSTGTVLTAELVRSGIVRSGDDRVEVFVLVNQSRTNKQSEEPVVYKNWVTVTMEKVDGDWLVAGMDT